MGKLATIIPNRMDLRVAGDDKQYVNLQFHKDDDHVDVIVNRKEVPALIEQLQKLTTSAADAG